MTWSCTTNHLPCASCGRTEIPEILERIARKAMAKDRRRRYRGGLDLAADLSLVFDYLIPKPH